MTDEQLIGYLNIADLPNAAEYVAKLPAERRALYNRMADVEMQLNLHAVGLGPMPAGVIVCREHKGKRKP